MIAETIVEALVDEMIVGAVEAVEMQTGTRKTKVGLFALISSHTCHATVGTDGNSTYRQCLVSTRPSTLNSQHSLF